MKRACKLLGIAGALGAIAIAIVLFIVRARLATVWPDDPGPVQVPYVVDGTPEALAVFEYFIGFGDPGFPGADLNIYDDPIAAALREPAPSLGSQVGEDEMGLNPSELPLDPPNVPDLVAGPVSPGNGLWDESNDYLNAFADIAEAGTFEQFSSFYDEHTPAGGILDATQLLALRARGWVENGYAVQAVDDYLLALNVLRTIQRSSTGLIVTLVAIIAEAIVLSDVTALASQWPTDQRRQLLVALRDRNSDPSYIANAMVHEYWFAEESLVVVEMTGLDEQLAATHNLAPSALPWNFSPARTRAMLYQSFQAAVDAAMLPPGARSMPETVNLTEQWGWQLDNGVGRVFIELWSVRQTAHLDHEDGLRTYRDLAVLRLALVEFEESTGAPAQRLADLTADVLPELPTDRFDHLTGATPGYLYSPDIGILASDFVDIGDTWPSEVRWP